MMTVTINIFLRLIGEAMFEKIKNFKLKKGKISDEEASFEIAKNYKVAEEIIKDRDKLEDFLNRLENKLRKFPNLGRNLLTYPFLILLIKSYCKRNIQLYQ